MIISQLKEGFLPHSPYSWTDNQLPRNGRLVVANDQNLQLKIIKLFHEKGLGGHLRMQATMKRLSSFFFFGK